MEDARHFDPPSPAEPEALGAADAPDSGDAATAFAYACPTCGSSVSLYEPPAGGLVECAACGAQFFVASGEEEDEAEADRRAREEAEEKVGRETEFNENRIKQFKALRRSLIRTRSYFVIGAAACLGIAAQLLYEAWPRARWIFGHRSAAKSAGLVDYALPLAMVFGAVAACLGCGYFIGRVRQSNRELAVPLLTDPETPPDFSTLSDGSHQWRGLEQMAGGGSSGGAGGAGEGESRNAGGN